MAAAVWLGASGGPAQAQEFLIPQAEPDDSIPTANDAGFTPGSSALKVAYGHSADGNALKALIATINVTRAADGQVAIEYTGVLESSPDLATPFTNVTGATSPYAVPAGLPPQLFFRPIK